MARKTVVEVRLLVLSLLGLTVSIWGIIHYGAMRKWVVVAYSLSAVASVIGLAIYYKYCRYMKRFENPLSKQ